MFIEQFHVDIIYIHQNKLKKVKLNSTHFKLAINSI